MCIKMHKVCIKNMHKEICINYANIIKFVDCIFIIMVGQI